MRAAAPALRPAGQVHGGSTERIATCWAGENWTVGVGTVSCTAASTPLAPPRPCGGLSNTFEYISTCTLPYEIECPSGFAVSGLVMRSDGPKLLEPCQTKTSTTCSVRYHTYCSYAGVPGDRTRADRQILPSVAFQSRMVLGDPTCLTFYDTCCSTGSLGTGLTPLERPITKITSVRPAG